MSARGKKFKVQRGGAKKFTPTRILRTQDNEEKAGMWDEPRNAKNDASDEDESSSSSSEDEEEGNASAAAPAISANANPNRIQKSNLKASDLTGNTEVRELSRREREEMEKERAKNAYWKAHLEGKTEQAQKDMARLAIVRKQREDAARKRAEETESKNKTSGAKADSLNAGKSIIKKRLG